MGSPNNAVERLTKADYELLAAFRYALRKFVGFSENAAIANGVSPQQYPGRNWVTIGELAEQMRIAHHSAVGMVDRMEGLGLLKRASSEQDRRRVQVSLTRKGHYILEKLYRIHRAELRSVGPQLAALLQKAASRAPE